MAHALSYWDIRQTNDEDVTEFFKAAPGGVRTTVAFSQEKRWDELDRDRVKGVIRSRDNNAFTKDGGLAVLYGNIAEKGCIVKTAGVDESIWTFTGVARVFESQDEAASAILTNKIKEGDVVVIRYEGPKGGPGMQEMLYPTTYLKSKGPGQGLRLADRTAAFPAARPGLSIGHASARKRRPAALIAPGRRRRRHRNRHPQPLDPSGGGGQCAGRAPHRRGTSRQAGLYAEKPQARRLGGAQGLCGAGDVVGRYRARC